MKARIRFVNPYLVDNITIVNAEELNEFFKDNDCENFLFFPIVDGDGNCVLDQVFTTKKEVEIFEFTSFKNTYINLNSYPYFCIINKNDVQILISEKEKAKIIKNVLDRKIYTKANSVLRKIREIHNEYEKTKKEINNYDKNKSQKNMNELAYYAKHLKNKIKELQRNFSFLRNQNYIRGI